MIRTPRPRLAVAGTVATAVLGAVLVPLSAHMASADTEPVAAGLAAPSNLTPDNKGAVPTPVLKSVALQWDAVEGATGYRVQIGTDDTWSDAPVLTQDTVTNTFVLPVLLPHASYVWRVAALKGKALGHWTSETGLPQNAAQFTRGWRDTAVPVSPASGTAVVGRPTFRWTPVDNASGYEVQVSTSPDFPRTVTASPESTPSPTAQTQTAVGTDTCFTARTQVTPFTSQAAHGVDSVGPCTWTVLGTGAPLYWRVRPLDRAADGAVDGDTTPASRAGISYLPPSDTPNNADISSDCPGSKPSASPSASATGSATPSATATATATVTASATATPTSSASPSATPAAGAVGGCTVAHASESGSWSTVTPFTATYPGTTGTLNPATLVTTQSLASDPDHLCNVAAADSTAETATCSDVPTIRWNAVPGASRYRVTVGLDDQFSNIQYVVESSALSWTAPDSWRDSSPALSYYYVVQACDATQCGLVTSTPPSFRKASPRTTLSASIPVKGAAVFSWSSYASRLKAVTGNDPTQDAYAYRLEVASKDDPSYDKPVIDVKVDGTSYVSPTESLSEGAYVWRVQALDSGAHALPWSASSSFLRDTVPPKITSVSPAAKVGTKAPITVTFSEPTTGVDSTSLTLTATGFASAYTVTVAPDGKSAVVAPSGEWVVGGSYALSLTSAVTDAAGNAALPGGPKFVVDTNVDDNNAALSYSSGWGHYGSSNATGRAYHAASGARRTVGLTFVGRTVTVLGCLSPKGGLVDVTVVGKATKRVSTYRSYSGCGIKLAVLSGLGSGPHTVRLTTTGTHVSASKGTSVGFDGLYVTP